MKQKTTTDEFGNTNTVVTVTELEKEQRRTRFHHLYANLPLGVRNEIVCVIDDEPCTFKVVRLEVDQKTEMGDRMLELMDSLEIL